MISLFLLLPLYSITIQYERGGLWRICYLAAPLALLIDVLLNYTELALLTLDFPKWGEWTFSSRLKRLKNSQTWRGPTALYLKKVLDVIAPSGKHI